MVGGARSRLETLGSRSDKTGLGYVSDLAGPGACLLEIVAKPIPETVFDDKAATVVPAACGALRPRWLGWATRPATPPTAPEASVGFGATNRD